METGVCRQYYSMNNRLIIHDVIRKWCGAILALPLRGFPRSSSTYVEYEKTQTVGVSWNQYLFIQEFTWLLLVVLFVYRAFFKTKLFTFIHYAASICDSLVIPTIRICTKVTNNIYQNNHVNKRTDLFGQHTHKYIENLSNWSVSFQALVHHQPNFVNNME